MVKKAVSLFIAAVIMICLAVPLPSQAAEEYWAILNTDDSRIPDIDKLIALCRSSVPRRAYKLENDVYFAAFSLNGSQEAAAYTFRMTNNKITEIIDKRQISYINSNSSMSITGWNMKSITLTNKLYSGETLKWGQASYNSNTKESYGVYVTSSYQIIDYYDASDNPMSDGLWVRTSDNAVVAKFLKNSNWYKVKINNGKVESVGGALTNDSSFKAINNGAGSMTEIAVSSAAADTAKFPDASEFSASSSTGNTVSVTATGSETGESTGWIKIYDKDGNTIGSNSITIASEEIVLKAYFIDDNTIGIIKFKNTPDMTCHTCCRIPLANEVQKSIDLGRIEVAKGDTTLSTYSFAVADLESMTSVKLYNTSNSSKYFILSQGTSSNRLMLTMNAGIQTTGSYKSAVSNATGAYIFAGTTTVNGIPNVKISLEIEVVDKSAVIASDSDAVISRIVTGYNTYNEKSKWSVTLNNGVIDWEHLSITLQKRITDIESDIINIKADISDIRTDITDINDTINNLGDTYVDYNDLTKVQQQALAVNLGRLEIAKGDSSGASYYYPIPGMTSMSSIKLVNSSDSNKYFYLYKSGSEAYISMKTGTSTTGDYKYAVSSTVGTHLYSGTGTINGVTNVPVALKIIVIDEKNSADSASDVSVNSITTTNLHNHNQKNIWSMTIKNGVIDWNKFDINVQKRITDMESNISNIQNTIDNLGDIYVDYSELSKVEQQALAINLGRIEIAEGDVTADTYYFPASGMTAFNATKLYLEGNESNNFFEVKAYWDSEVYISMTAGEKLSSNYKYSVSYAQGTYLYYGKGTVNKVTNVPIALEIVVIPNRNNTSSDSDIQINSINISKLNQFEQETTWSMAVKEGAITWSKLSTEIQNKINSIEVVDIILPDVTFVKRLGKTEKQYTYKSGTAGMITTSTYIDMSMGTQFEYYIKNHTLYYSVDHPENMTVGEYHKTLTLGGKNFYLNIKVIEPPSNNGSVNVTF